MANPAEKSIINRRSFLKSSSLAAGAAVLALLADRYPAAALDPALLQDAVYLPALSRLFKGTRDGQILESTDAGKTWQRVMNFGPDCAVQSLSFRRGQFGVTLTYRGLTFSLHSRDGRSWYSS